MKGRVGGEKKGCTGQKMCEVVLNDNEKYKKLGFSKAI